MKRVKLRLKLKQVGRIIFGWVVYQDEGLRVGGFSQRKTLASRLLPFTKRKFKIESFHEPELREDRLYVRGFDRVRDNEPFASAYRDYEEAREVYDTIVGLVAQINWALPPESEAPRELPSMETVE